MRLPILALFARALRVDARAMSTYAKRFGLLAVIFSFLAIAHSASRVRSAAGLHMFEYVLWINLLFISLAGLSHFASVITEEKEQETLGLLKMSRLNAVAILLGKSTARLSDVVMLLLVQVPFTLLAVTLGGVSTTHVLAAYATMLAYVVLLANLALFCSVACRRTGRAAGLTLLLVGAFAIGGPIVSAIFRAYEWQGWFTPDSAVYRTMADLLDGVLRANPFFRIIEICGVGFAGHPIGLQVISNVVAALAFFLLSWATFERFTREQKAPGPARGVLAGGATRASSPRRWLGLSRPWRPAIAWKDFHFVAGGRMMIAAKCLALTLIPLIIICLYNYGSYRSPGHELIGGAFMLTSLVLGAFEVMVHAARMFQEEVRWHTLSDLAIVPISIRQLAYHKALGMLPGLVPYAAFFLLGAVINPEGFAEGIDDILGSVIGWHVIVQYIAFIHFVAYLSLTFRRAGVLIALGIWIVGNIVLGAIFQPDSQAGFEAYCVFMSLAFIVFTIVVHARTLRRLEELAGQ